MRELRNSYKYVVGEPEREKLLETYRLRGYCNET